MKNIRILLQVVLLSFVVFHAHGQYYDEQINHMQLEGMYSSDLESAAANLSAEIDTGDPNTEFKVLSYSLMPSLAAVSEDCFEHSLNYVYEDLETKSNYLAIIKTIESEGSPDNLRKFVKFYIKYSLPNTTTFDTISILLLEGINKKLTRIADEKYNLTSNTIAVEISIMQDISNAIIYGNYQEEEALDELGFFPLTIEGHEFRLFELPAINGDSESNRNNSAEYDIEISLNDQNNWSALGNYINGTIVVNGNILNVDYTRESFFEIKFFEDIETLMEENDLHVYLQIYVVKNNDGTNVDPVIYWQITTNIDDLQKEDIVFEEFKSQMNYANWGVFKSAIKGNESSDRRNLPDWALWGHKKMSSLVDGTDEAKWKAFSYGYIDGFLGLLAAIQNMTKAASSYEFKSTFDIEARMIEYVKKSSLTGRSYFSTKTEFIDNLGELRDQIGLFIENLDADKIYDDVKEAIGDYFVGISEGKKEQFYSTGKIFMEITFEVLGAVFSGGVLLVTSSRKLLSLATDMIGTKNFRNFIRASINKTKQGVKNVKQTVCKILFGGCFVKDTPVLMARNANQFSLKNKGKALAMAAAMPIVAVPIQEVQLLEYAVAHETVNSTSLIDNDLVASADEDIYYGLLESQAERRTLSGAEMRSQDPYTSDQQRERDEYEINDTDWNEVVFEEVNGSSTAKLALHDDWIGQKGYQVDAVVEMNLPEQGISGPFRITSIKHIIPQKKPVDDDEADDYNYRPVTALFTHESNQVYNIDFDNGESLGVTYQHPIYSVSKGDWKLAGELEIGEEVLTKSGNTKVLSTTKKEGSETVYNLEVKELHNFLVGEGGILVHNSCWDEAAEYASKKRNTSEIWAMKGYPQIFKRGGIIEKIIRKSKFKKPEWKYTGKGDGGDGYSNFWLIDFYKDKKVVSLKSTDLTDGTKWANQNADHIKKLNARKNAGSFPNCNTAHNNCNNPSKIIEGIEEAELHIVVEDLSKIDQNTWKTKILAKLDNADQSGFKIVFSEL